MIFDRILSAGLSRCVFRSATTCMEMLHNYFRESYKPLPLTILIEGSFAR